MSGGYRDLRVWQQAMELVYSVYEATDSFPDREKYGLTSQMRRAAVSIPSNIAEGKGRTGNKELGHFLSTARGSLHELETQIMIAAHLKYLDGQSERDLLEQVTDVGKMLSGFLSFAANN